LFLFLFLFLFLHGTERPINSKKKKKNQRKA